MYPGLKVLPFSPNPCSGLQAPGLPSCLQMASRYPWAHAHAVPLRGTLFLPLLLRLAAVPPSDLSSRATCSRMPCLTPWLMSLLHYGLALSLRTVLWTGSYFFRWISAWVSPRLTFVSLAPARSLTQRSLSNPAGGRIGTLTYYPYLFSLIDIREYIGIRREDGKPISSGVSYKARSPLHPPSDVPEPCFLLS